MEYACAIWSGGPTAKLKKLQRSFCRSHGVSLPPLQTRFDYFTLMLFYKIRMRLSPQSLQNMLPNPSSHSGYQFRKMPYPIPKVILSPKFNYHSVTYFQLAFYVYNINRDRVPRSLYWSLFAIKTRSRFILYLNNPSTFACTREHLLLFAFFFVEVWFSERHRPSARKRRPAVDLL